MSTPRKILVIDDEADICDLVRLLLERAGHEVVATTNSRTAMSLLAERAFDVVITDMLMPDRDGLEIMADLRRNYPTVRVIASSGGGRISSDSYLQIAKKSGAHGVLPKPFTHRELNAVVDAAFIDEHASVPTEVHADHSV
jgi:DNA-binding NtrC family response regulator